MFNAFYNLGLTNKDVINHIWNNYLDKTDRYTLYLTSTLPESLNLSKSLTVTYHNRSKIGFYIRINYPKKYMKKLIKKGYLDLLEFMVVKLDLPLPKNCINIAAKYGKINMLEWIKNNNKIDYDNNIRACNLAAEYGHLDALKWLVDNKFDKYLTVDTFMEAAGNGDLEVLKWLLSKGCPWNETTCIIAAGNGHLEVLKWARENDCPWDESTCSFAAEMGELETLKWAREKGCPWDKNTCRVAAAGNHLEVLKWARENGCPWNEDICSNASVNNNFELLKWARENGCPWDKRVTTYAYENDNIKILEYAVKNGCDWDDIKFRRVDHKPTKEMKQWVRSNGGCSCCW